jgi:uncharacterized repeat protein (TIGR02543 family)
MLAAIPALGHDWGEAEYVWSEDWTTVTATRICGNDNEHVETETAPVVVQTTAASGGNDGEKTYTAVFTNAAFETQIRTMSVAAEVFLVTFDANGGGGRMPSQQVYENTEAALNYCTFTREGYAFAGWNTKADGSGTAYADGAGVTLTGDLTLYAQWEASETAIRSVENISTDDGPACRALVFCAGANLTAYAARYDDVGCFLGIETMALQPGENTFTILRGDAAVVRFYVLNSLTWAPVCEAAEAPELNPQE